MVSEAEIRRTLEQLEVQLVPCRVKLLALVRAWEKETGGHHKRRAYDKVEEQREYNRITNTIQNLKWVLQE